MRGMCAKRRQTLLELPERYRLEVRLGRAGDIEEWLATDEMLDRPVLVRVLGPEASPDRTAAYLQSVRTIAATNHVHLAAVFAAGISESGAYSILEWTGGMTVADRLHAGETISVEEFLPNAAGLASGLAALHAAGVIHGAIGPEAVLYSTAHPAKLGGFGAPRKGYSTRDDVAALAETLTLAVVGATDVQPSQIADGLSHEVDIALAAAKAGRLDAAGLAAAMRAAPSAPPPPVGGEISWRWLIPAAVLLVVALAVSGIGLAIQPDSESPFLFPATPPRSTPVTTAPLTDVVDPPTEDPALSDGEDLLAVPAIYDPFGDQQEGDARLASVADGDDTTSWQTETYRSPISALKPGVGITFAINASPRTFEVIGSAGTRFALSWAPTVPEDFEDWEPITTGTLLTGRTRISLPEREPGVWLVWLTDLPEVEPDRYRSELNEVRWLS